MDRKNDIRAEISFQERKIDEYNGCINDLRNVELKLKSHLNDFDFNVYIPMQHYSVTDDDLWVGNNADNATDLKASIQEIFYRLSAIDADAVVCDIYRTINIYEAKIVDCKSKIMSLYNELDSILEAD